ncbi:MAG: hypothetical protein H6767_07725 [Candidatus Peribacteria bacterium]|nr:MAG: hypothetical protein H6767_07725 [Candidatus Peribacteria bacterium]
MHRLPFAIKLVLNLVFFCIYVIISIVLVNFVYGFVVAEWLGGNVPGSSDPVHMKMATVVFLVVIIITILYRKYFYLSLRQLGNTLQAPVVDMTELFEKHTANTPKPKTTKKTKIKQETPREEGELEIYIGKEIK